MKHNSWYDLLLLKNHHTKKVLDIMRISTFLFFLTVWTSFASPSSYNGITQQGNTIVGVITDNYGTL